MNRKLLLCYLLVLVTNTFLVGQMQKKTKAAYQKDVEALINYAFSETKAIPGLSMSVVKDGKTIYEKGFGYANLEEKQKMKGNTSFYIASCTKAFTGLLAAILDEEGVIPIDATLASYFPKTKFDSKLEADKITIRSLINHTSGLKNSPIGFRAAYTGDHTHAQMVKLLTHSEPNKVGRGNYRYTNVGYNIYTLIVQEVTGKKWQDLLEEKIFSPLGMNRTTAYISKAEKGNWPMALPYMAEGPEEFRSVYLLKKDNTMQSAGGLITTAADLAKWANVHLNEGKLNGKQVFSQKIMQDAHRNWASCDEKRGPFQAAGYGYGWLVGELAGQKAVWHSGGFPGYLSVMSFLPEHKLGVNVLINEPSVGFRLMYLLAAFSYDWWLTNEDVLGNYKAQVQEMAQQLTKRQARVAKHKKELAERTWQLSKDFNAYSGRYVNEQFGTIEIDGSNNQLAVKMGNMHCIATPYTKKNTARVEMVPGSGEVLAFKVEDGRVTGLNTGGDTFKKVSK